MKLERHIFIQNLNNKNDQTLLINADHWCNEGLTFGINIPVVLKINFLLFVKCLNIYRPLFQNIKQTGQVTRSSTNRQPLEMWKRLRVGFALHQAEKNVSKMIDEK